MVWYPEAQRLPFAYSDGGSMLGGAPRGTLHTTESYAYVPSTTSYYGHRNPPHFTVDPQRNKIYQHYPLHRAARALRNKSGGVQTNRQGKWNVQVELVWKAANIRSFPDPSLDQLRDLMLWCRDNLHVPFETTRRFMGSQAWGEHSAARMTSGQWVAYTGWCGHQHVPENSHWDPGLLDVDKLFQLPEPPPAGGYVDEDEWPSWAKPSIEKAIASGIMVGATVNGQKVWDPNGTVTRDQLAVILDRCELLEGTV